MVNLICQWYSTPSAARNSELGASLEANVRCGHFDRVHVLDTSGVFVSRNPKVSVVRAGTASRRLTYGDALAYAGAELRGQRCVLANTDVYADSTASQLSLLAEDEFWCLTRWERGSDGPVLSRTSGDSHDAWVFVAGSIETADIEMGRVGCDNRIAAVALEAGLRVSNPCMSVRFHHMHATGWRNYGPARLEGAGAYVYPCSLGEAGRTKLWRYSGGAYQAY